MDRRERGPGISTRSDSLPSGTRQVQAFVVAPKGLLEAFFFSAFAFAKASCNMRASAAAREGGPGKRKPS